MSAPVRVRDFKRVVFFTGAGMSAESGIPTFRGKGGMWEQYNFEEYACQAAFERDPEKVWEFHQKRREIVAACEPHQGHRLIAEMEELLPDVTIVTQNIDGMHQYAGSKKVLELHGNLWRVRCESCGLLFETDRGLMPELKHECGSYYRPHIVWFGDQLFEDVIEESLLAIVECDLLVSIGTSAVVFPAAEMPAFAKKAGARLVEINLEDTPMSDLYDTKLRGPASEILAEICAA
jgi:NAD-dependent deacetylase